jgi:hypothetical protein
MNEHRHTTVAATALAAFASLWFVIHSSAHDKRRIASPPFLDKSAYSDRLGRVMHDTLANHRFSIPWIAVRAADGSLWFVAERFQSERRLDRIKVQVTPDENVTASITPYQFGPSDWAILGKLLADFRPEAELVARELASKLNDNKKKVR